MVSSTWLATLAGRGGYATLNRVLPVIAGIGLVLMSVGARHLWDHRRQLALLALTLLSPVPFALQQLLTPTRLTAALATGLVRVLGVQARLAGTVLVFPDTDATLRVCGRSSSVAERWQRPAERSADEPRAPSVRALVSRESSPRIDLSHLSHRKTRDRARECPV